MKLVDLIRHNDVFFDSYRQGTFYYRLEVFTGRDKEGWRLTDWYLFTIPIEDLGSATLPNKDKAIYYMRWIRKALEDGTLTKL